MATAYHWSTLLMDYAIPAQRMLNIVQAMFTYIMLQVFAIANKTQCRSVLIGHFHYISSSNGDKSYLSFENSIIGLLMISQIITALLLVSPTALFRKLCYRIGAFTNAV